MKSIKPKEFLNLALKIRKEENITVTRAMEMAFIELEKEEVKESNLDKAKRLYGEGMTIEQFVDEYLKLKK